MHVGWLTLGEGHPLDPLSNNVDELVNNRRVLAYAGNAGVGWLLDCDDCPAVMQLTPGDDLYNDPVSDPAPWYDSGRPDSKGFLGIFGLELTGTEDSTRRASVSQALGSKGLVGAAYHAPRQMVLRALAVATDDCALAEGMRWLRERVDITQEPCVGDVLTLFDCCPSLSCAPTVDPCPCDDMTTLGGPCWANTYGELRDGPTECTPDWWPSTYGELKAGPPTDDEWCHWVYVYYELRIGADAWTCGSETCLVPYLRQYDHAAIIEGPTVIARHVLSVGAVAEIEMTIVAADPFDHGLADVAEAGCGIHTAIVVARTSTGFKTLGELTPLLLVRWHRVRDEISAAEVVVGTSQCCDLLADLRTVLHEIHIYRNGEAVWEGPIVRIEYDLDQVRIFAEDVLWIATRSAIEKGYNHVWPNVGLVLDTMDALLLDCYGRQGDQWHMLPHHLHPIRTPDEPVHYRVTNDWQMYVWEDMDKFAEDYGVDYTVVNRDIYYWDVHVAWKVLAPLDESWISDIPRIVEYGNSLATRCIVTNGRGFASIDEAGLPTTGPSGYGYVDDLVNNANESDNPAEPSAEELLGWQGTALKNLSGRWPPPVGIVVPDNTTLLPGSPWQVRDLIPGAWFEVNVTRLCRQVSGWERLQQITVEELPSTGETIKFTSITAPKTMVRL